MAQEVLRAGGIDGTNGPHSKSLRTVQGANQPLDEVPWFLVLGDADSGQRLLLNAASDTVPLVFSSEETLSSENILLRTRFCLHWWLYEELAAIETPPGLARPDSDRFYLDSWGAQLARLRSRRRRALNGVLVLVSASALRGSKRQLRDYGVVLQRRLSEVTTHLRLQLPVYVIVTRCDRLPGFAEFLAYLSDSSVRQPLGYQASGSRLPEAAVPLAPHEVFDSIYTRLQAVKTNLLEGENTTNTSSGIADFVEAFRELDTGLEVLVQQLFGHNHLKASFWRGLFFAGTQPQSAFLRALFAEVLPCDRSLARRVIRLGNFAVQPVNLISALRRKRQANESAAKWGSKLAIALLAIVGFSALLVLGLKVGADRLPQFADSIVSRLLDSQAQ